MCVTALGIEVSSHRHVSETRNYQLHVELMSPIHPGSADLMEVIEEGEEASGAEAAEGLSFVIPSFNVTPTARMVRKKGSGVVDYIGKELNQTHSDLSFLELFFR